jgi:uncharacterized cofD-like protein
MTEPLTRPIQREGGFRQLLRWFRPGLNIKRWLVLILLGITLLGLGVAVVLIDLYRTNSTDPLLLNILSYASLRFLPRLLRAIIFGGLGVGLVGLGMWQLNHALLQPFVRPGRAVIDELSTFRRLERGPRIVAIGGGHGLASLLRGLRDQTHNLTAVVTVADDGGSSGRLRESLGILPPGDIRNCLAALSSDEDLMTQLFHYRFSGSGGLDGHSFGNLFITALSDITGSFEEAVAESARVLSVHGRVLPSTLHNVRLVADLRVPHVTNEIRVEGESHIPEVAGRVRRVWLEPNNAPAFPPVIQSLLLADMIVVGPGSLYTSILPNLLVSDLLAALRASRALKVFICNIAAQSGETEAYTCSDHVRAVEEHTGENLFDLVLCNDNYDEKLAKDVEWVRLDPHAMADGRVYATSLVDPSTPWRHDSARLAGVLMNLYYERTGPLK